MSTAPRIAGSPRPTPPRRLGLLALPLGLGGCLGLPLSQPAWEVEVAFELHDDVWLPLFGPPGMGATP